MAESRNYKEIAAALRPRFPKADKASVSYAMNTEKYGTTFCDEAKAIAAPWLPKAPVKRREGKRVKCHGWRVRLSPEAHELLNARMIRLGYSTKQAYLENLLREELREERKYREVSHG
jgi:hypothetical protein